METQFVVQVLHEIAEQEIPAMLDLWPKISAQVEPIKKDLKSLPGSMSKDPLRFRQKLLWAALAVAVLIGLILTIPAARAAIGEMFQRDPSQRYGLVLVDSPDIIDRSMDESEPSAQPYPAPQEEPIAEEVQILPQLSLEAAQNQAPFPIPVPTWLPADLVLQRVFVGEGGSGTSCSGGNCITVGGNIEVVLGYGSSDDESLETDKGGLTIYIYPGRQAGGLAVPKSEVQETAVNGLPALYVIGTWQPKEEDDLFDLEWISEADSGVLSWEDEEYTFTITFDKLGLDLEQVIKIAESLHP